MRLRDKLLLIGAAAGLALAAALVFAGRGPREPVEQLVQQPVAEGNGKPHSAVLDEGASATDTGSTARTRAASEFGSDDIPFVDADRRREARKREADFVAEFLALRTEQGSAAFERTVREVLASNREPASRKSAGLRALHTAGVPGTDAVLVAAVEQQPDVPDGASISVPRSALKLLFERAASGEDARRALARLAFVQEAHVSADLRRRASTALSASIHGAQHDEVVRLLRLEASAQQLEAALEALSRDPNFGAERHE
jgi:hypothetical protein